MSLLRRLGTAAVTFALVAAATPLVPEGDPVVQARAQRAAALNIPEDDLPPVPRGIVEPPPLPPPEIHPKDLRRGRRGGARKGSPKAGAKKKAGAARKAPKKATRKGG
ncbi:MAG: hypothetical protein HY823_11020 [Acidobacteria bacterium]|nr:hypothetical protein [Acidobacteriota bacterium]